MFSVSGSGEWRARYFNIPGIRPLPCRMVVSLSVIAEEDDE